MTSARYRRLSRTGLIVAGVGALALIQLQPSFAAGTGPPAREVAPAATKPTIVLVLGAFADGTGWQHVIPLLERDGYNVVAVQNPLSALATNAATASEIRSSHAVFVSQPVEVARVIEQAVLAAASTAAK